ncbi:MAG: SDR family NAD(P)-dependent oxidoreductase [Verrucomicrobia bacterium]|nr:SDR family NAD(P)-dependent oxidoreductase [Verrucomicrobiota bacterium]
MSSLDPKSVAEPLAVVGLACRFPGGANSPAAFWQLLCEGRDAIVDVPPERWSTETFYDPDPSVTGKMYVRRGGFMTDSPFDFDARFFHVNPHEAVRLDPQQQLVLELAWEAMEDAGLPLDRLAGSRTGVYIGVFCLDNMLIHFSQQNHAFLNAHTAAAATMAIVANRVSYTFDLRGPSVALDTACSSSLVAFHLACQSLRSGECDHVLVGGVNVMLKPEYTISMCKGKFLSPDGRCKAFDASADGYGRGEGAGMIIIKRLAQAQRDGDRIYAVVRGSGANQDGATPGISVPNPQAQIALLREVYGQAGVNPASVQYVEAHGTGTAVGDPIEALALGTVLSDGRPAERPCLLGSVKTNIGHLEAAAGVAGAMKAILAVYHGFVPPSLHFHNPNPNIDFGQLKLHVQTKLGPWPDTGQAPRRAGVNSFGYGGTNAHILVESAPQADATALVTARPSPRTALCFPFSARSVDALKALAGRYVDALIGHGDLSDLHLADVSHSLCLRRTHHERRAAVVTDNREDLVARLRALHAGQVEVTSALGEPEPGLAFVFTGMGPQWWGMGKELYQSAPVFRAAIDRLEGIFGSFADFSLVEELLRDEHTSRATETHFAQSLNFALQVALAELLRSQGIVPKAIVGHSVGEVAAAAIAGALSLDDASLAIFHRGRLQARTAGQGGMLAVGLSEAEARAFIRGLEEQVSIAAINGPSNVTLSGNHDALDSLAKVLDEEKVFARKLKVEVPYHSICMDPLRDELLAALARLVPTVPTIPLWSTVSGQRVENAAHHAAYWWSNVREPVRFADAAGELIRAGFRHFLEIGPHSVLAISIRECAQARGVQVQTVATLIREKPELRAMMESTGRLWELGYSPRWQMLLPGDSRYVRLPTYPWQRQRFWGENEVARRLRLGYTGHPLLGHPVVGSKPVREVELNRQYFPWLVDHRVNGLPVFPGVGYAEIGVALAGPAPEQAIAIEDLEFQRPLVVANGDPPRIQIHFEPRTGEFEVHGCTAGSEGGWVLCARGAVRRTHPGPWKGDSGESCIKAIRLRCGKKWDATTLYQRLAETGLDYGPCFRGIVEASLGDGEVLVCARGPADGGRHGEAYRLHPTVLDLGLQALAVVAEHRDPLGANRRFLPVRIASVTSYAPIAGPLLVHSRLTKVTATEILGEVDFFTEAGQPVASLRGVSCALVAARPQKAPVWKDLLFESRWVVQSEIASESLPPSASTAPVLDDVLVFAPAAEAPALERLLRQRGVRRLVVATPGTKHGGVDPEHLSFRPGEDLAPLLGQSAVFRNVVWVAGVTDGKTQAEVALAETKAFLSCLRALDSIGQGGRGLPLVLVVTRNVHRLDEGPAAPDIGSAPLWGVARVARLEQPELRLRTVDLGVDSGFEVVVAELECGEDAETEVAWRRDQRLVRRLDSTDGTLASAPWPPLRSHRQKAAFVLKSETRGSLDGLRLRRLWRRAPEPNEVEVEVKSVPINFKDVMKALGMLSSRVLTPTHFGEELGMECAGVIARVGKEVRGLRVGDRVALSYQGSFRSHLTTADLSQLVRLPDGMKIEDGCSFITPMVAAWYALVERGRLCKGERILIHSATGGAGLSAIQIARRIGAEIYATAGTPERRDYLRSIGIEHVSDSRSLAFFDDIMAWTQGKGVDVVLNTLAGEGLLKGLKLLRPYGRFIEFGKRDIDLNTPIGLAPFNENLDFIAVDFDRLRAERPHEYLRIMREVWQALEAGQLMPLPSKSLPISKAVEAFKHMARSQHIGKLVLSFDDPAAVVHPELPDDAPPVLRGTWLIVGGLTGLGLTVAKWAVARGVRNLVLAGRRGSDTPEAAQGVADLEKLGAKVRVVKADVANLDETRALVDTKSFGMPTLRGVVHSAAVMDDGLVASITDDKLERVMSPKVKGAWNLHECTKHCELDAFILFSSVSSLLGNVGQASYAAANAFLDALAQRRRADGLPALTVNWGVLGETGMVARADGLRQQLERIGMRPLVNDEVLGVLDRLVRLDPVQIGVFAVNWKRWATIHLHAAAQPALAHLMSAHAASEGTVEGDLAASISTLPSEERVPYLVDRIHQIVADTMRLPREKIDAAEPIRNLGFDSLMAVELATALEGRMGVPISSMELMTGPSVQQLAEKMAARCLAGTAKARA